MKKGKRAAAFLLSLMMVFPTQGMTAFGNTKTASDPDIRIGTEASIEAEIETVPSETEPSETEPTETEESAWAEPTETEESAWAESTETNTAEDSSSETPSIETDNPEADETTLAQETVAGDLSTGETLPPESAEKEESGGGHISEILPLEPLPLEPVNDDFSLDGLTEIYWNPGSSAPEGDKKPSTASSSDSDYAADYETGSDGGEGTQIPKGSDGANGFTPEHPVKSLEKALKQAEKLAVRNNLELSDIIIYAMNPMEIPDGTMYVLNGANMQIAAWPERDYNNDTIFYLNGGRLALINTSLESGSGAAGAEEAELVHVYGGALQLGQNAHINGRIVMDYRKDGEKEETATQADASFLSAEDTASVFDLNNYIVNTSESEWDFIRKELGESIFREPVIELIEGFNGEENSYLLELRSDDSKQSVTLARTLYADETEPEAFAGFFRLADTAKETWNLLPAGEEAATVRDTGGMELDRYYRSMRPLMPEEGENEVSEEAEENVERKTGTSAVMTVKTLSAARSGRGTTKYWNPGPGFNYMGKDYPAGDDESNDGNTETSAYRTLEKAVQNANGGTIIAIQTLNLSDADAGEYLKTKEGDSWYAKGNSSDVIPTLKVWDVKADPIFHVPAGEKLILENIVIEGMTKDGGSAETEAVVVDGGDLTIREGVTAETGFVQINVSSTLKDHPIHADSTKDVSVNLFFSGINRSLDYVHTDVVAPTERILPDTADEQQKIEMGQTLLRQFHLATANLYEEKGGNSLFDWSLRPDEAGDDSEYNPQNLELYAEYYYDAVYLDGERGNDLFMGASCETPVKNFERAVEILKGQLDRSVAARRLAKQNKPDMTIEELNKKFPYPDKIYICGTVKPDETAADASGNVIWSLPEDVYDYNGDKINLRLESHCDIPSKSDGSGIVHELPKTLIEVADDTVLTLKLQIHNYVDLPDSQTVLVKGSKGHLILSGASTGTGAGGTCILSGEPKEASDADKKTVTKGCHIKAADGATVEITGDAVIKTRQQGIVADGSGTRVLMNGGTIRENDAYANDTSSDTANLKYGGGVALSGGASMTMSGGSICENKAYDTGSGIYLTGAGTTFTMTGGMIENNTFSMKGSNWTGIAQGIGIYADKDTVCNIGTATGNPSDVVIKGNNGYLVHGAGIYSLGRLNIKRAEITGNTGDTSIGDRSDFSGSYWLVKGAGIYVGESGTLDMDGAMVTGNKVEAGRYQENGYGAGICLLSGNENSIKNSDITENIIGYGRDSSSQAVSDYSRGGGIYYEPHGDGARLEISNTVIGRNRAQSGAGIHMSSYQEAMKAKLNITNCVFENNITSRSRTAEESPVVSGFGGGISGSVLKGSEIVVKDSLFTDNKARTGGGIFMSREGALRLLGTKSDGVKIIGNEGGGLYKYMGSAIYGENVLVSGNTQQGGMYLHEYGINIFRKCNIIGNESIRNGGGISAETESNLYLEDVKVEDNRSELSGGGISAYIATIYWSETAPGRSSLKGNVAKEYGGGIYTSGSTSRPSVLDFSGNIKNSAGKQGSNFYLLNCGLSITKGVLRQPDTAAGGVYNVYIASRAASDGIFGMAMDPTTVQIEKKTGGDPDAVYLATGSSQLRYYRAPADNTAGTLPIDVNTDVFGVGSVVVFPGNIDLLTSYKPNAALTAAESYTIPYEELQDASVNKAYSSGGKLTRRTQLGAFKDASSADRTNLVLVGEGVYLAGPASGGDDDNHDGSSPDQAVATFRKAKAILKEQIEARQTEESVKPEADRLGYSPYIYICGTVPVMDGEEWELDYEDEVYKTANAAFAASEKEYNPDVDEESLLAQVRRFASFVKAPMIKVERNAAFYMNRIIVNGMAEAVQTSVQGTASPLIDNGLYGTVKLTGDTQLCNNFGRGIVSTGPVILEGEAHQKNKQIKDIYGDSVLIVGAGYLEMRGHSRIVFESCPLASSNSPRGVYLTITNGVPDNRSSVIMKDDSAIQGLNGNMFSAGIQTYDTKQADIYMEDSAKIDGATAGIYIRGKKNTVSMNRNTGAQTEDSARIMNCTNGISVSGSGSGFKLSMGKKAEISGNKERGVYVSYSRGEEEPSVLEMLDDSVIRGNGTAGIAFYTCGPVTVDMKNQARIVRNGVGILNSTNKNHADRLTITMADDSHISANKTQGIVMATIDCGTWNEKSYQKLILSGRAMVGGSTPYTADEDDENCGNSGHGIRAGGPAVIELLDSSKVWNNGGDGVVFQRGGYVNDKAAELEMSGSSAVSNNQSHGINVSDADSANQKNPVKVTIKGDAKVADNQVGGAADHEIYLNKESELYLEDNAKLWADKDTKDVVCAMGKVYLDGTVSVKGRIWLNNSEYPITLKKAPTAAGSPFHLHLAEGFIGKPVVIPDGMVVTNASVYLSCFVKDEAEGLAKEKSLAAAAPDIILEGENNVYLSGDGNDANDGNSPTTAVRTFHRARELLRTGRYAKGANILICNSPVKITKWSDASGKGQDDDWSFDQGGTVTNQKTGDTWKPLVLRSDDYDNVMVYVTDSQNIVFKNITLDGKKDVVTATSAMVFVNKGASAVLGEGAVLQNGRITNQSQANAYGAAGIAVNEGTLSLEGGIIQGMERTGLKNYQESLPAGSALYAENTSVVHMKSGQIRDNTLNGDLYSRGAAVTIKGSTFTMTGGTISGNVNQNNNAAEIYQKEVCGAGLYVYAGMAQLKGGYIRDNRSNRGSGVYYQDSDFIKRDERGLLLSGGEISNNKANSSLGDTPDAPYSPIYAAGPNFRLEGGGCDIRDRIYLQDTRGPILVSGDIYQSGRQYQVMLNQGTGATMYHKGSVVVAPDGDKKTDVTGYLPYFSVTSNPYVLDRGQIDQEILTGGNIKENQCLLLMQAVYIDGEKGDDSKKDAGQTPKNAVKTFTKAKERGESGVGPKDYYIIYVCGKITNTTAETVWNMEAPAYMCRYTGFTVYQENGKPAEEVNTPYYGYLVEPEHDLTIDRMIVYGRRSVDSLDLAGNSLVRVPAGVTVTVRGGTGKEPLFGRNYNMGQYNIGDGGALANMDSKGGAFRVEPDGRLEISSGRIVETDAAFGSAIYLGTDAKDPTKTGHLILDGSPLINGSVYLSGTGKDTASYVEPRISYAPAGALSIAVENDYNGRECVRYPEGTSPGIAGIEKFSFEDSIYALYDVIYRTGADHIIELNQKTALYLDGVNGDDGKDGRTPETAFKTVKKVYESIAERQTQGETFSDGILVYVVGTVTVDGTYGHDIVMNNVQKTVNGKKHYEGNYSDEGGSLIKVMGQVYFKRYAKPKAYDPADSFYQGYARETMTGELFRVTDGGKLTLWGMYLDGHSQDTVSSNKLYDADGVEAMAPLVSVSDGGVLSCQYKEAQDNSIATSTMFLNNKNIKDKTIQIGTINSSPVYEGSSAGIELLDGGWCELNHAEFKNLSLGDKVKSGGTDIYHNGGELNFYNDTLFSGTVFLEGQGVSGQKDTYSTSRYLTVGKYGRPMQHDFQILMRDSYLHRTVVYYKQEGAGLQDKDQVGAFRLEEEVKEFFYLEINQDKPWILELIVPSSIYIDGVNGSDTLEGDTPARPVKTLKRAYELLNARGGDTIIVVNTVQVDKNASITGSQYEGTDGVVNLRSTDKVNFIRYIQPDFAHDGSESEEEVRNQGFLVEDFTGVLLKVQDGKILKIGNRVCLDGHSEPKVHVDFPKEITVTGTSTAKAPLIEVGENSELELLAGSLLRDNNNVFDTKAGDTGAEGGAVNNRGIVTVNGAAFSNNHAKKGDAAYQAGTFTIKNGTANLDGHSFYLASRNKGTDDSPNWEDSVLWIEEAVPDGQIFDVDMDHAVAGRDVIKFTSDAAYTQESEADAEHEHFRLGTTVPGELFLVEAEADASVLELQDWKILHAEVPDNIYLVVTQKGNSSGSVAVRAVQEGTPDLFDKPKYQIINNGRYDIKVSITGIRNENDKAGIPASVDKMKLIDSPAAVSGEKEIYLGIKGADSDPLNGLTAGEIPLTEDTFTTALLGQLKAGSTGNFEFNAAVGYGFVDKYKDQRFPLTDSAENVRKYMDGSGSGVPEAKANYLLKYKVEMVPSRR